jgi:hypothetical protein
VGFEYFKESAAFMKENQNRTEPPPVDGQFFYNTVSTDQNWQRIFGNDM